MSSFDSIITYHNAFYIQMILYAWGIEPHLREFRLPVEQFNYLIKPGKGHWDPLRTIRDQVIM